MIDLSEHSLLSRVVRDGAAARYAREKGVSLSDARKTVALVSDDSIAHAADAAGMAFGQLGDGKILAWIVAHREQIAQLIEIVFQLALLFA